MAFDEQEFETLLADSRELAHYETLELQAELWGDLVLRGDLG
ncbi:MAG: hypothetical protein ACE14M_06975 [Terriglobales bacterium]